MVQRAKKFKNIFFQAYADSKLASNYLTSIVGINKIIPAFAYGRKKLFLNFLALCTMIQNLSKKHKKNSQKLEF
jgi:hypothetical protein